MKFKDSLKDGQEHEKKLAEYIEKHHGIKASYNGDKKNDLIFEELGKSIEVKHDRRCYCPCPKTGRPPTGNIGIEIQSHGKPSGYYTTEADAWVWSLETPTGELVYIAVKREDLDIAFTHGREVTLPAGTGEGNYNLVMLVKTADIGDYTYSVSEVIEEWML